MAIASPSGLLRTRPLVIWDVFKGMAQLGGHTEPLLHAWQLKVNAAT